ncbi:hypothetical protein AWB91_03375 [Mycobacterium paraense]|uniref:Uncharacterized protein n=1 Tax=Mycobacterium paraense TaxID=767916 RepID=A0A1X2AF79_9MYCO|nr:hypothetical protein [Mycobacterium paraense]MCV7443985.1 hypothetical protein [Mycobacterium paraense]ORW27355.1 hypothetical protein AWB91_03375 [Mycobacterium paraense]ORW43927.1 hypothetical protein AWB88_06660 [Mycobacterium paraense]ORW47709.1 hypothetical protein AWB89_07905 [Mycobacterium paraense]ORW49966.1 hypothetical protein AWB90_08155 [Mycobacterium paraense]
MRTAAEKKANRKLGFLRLAMVSSATAILVALGMGVAYVNTPSAGHPCSVRNATIRDAAGRTMWCNPGADGGAVVWQYAQAS